MASIGRFAIAAGAVVASALSTPAPAAIVTASFAGIVSATQAPFSGSFSYNDATQPNRFTGLAPFEAVSYFDNALLSFSFSYGGITYDLSAVNEVYTDDYFTPDGDAFVLTAFSDPDKSFAHRQLRLMFGMDDLPDGITYLPDANLLAQINQFPYRSADFMVDGVQRYGFFTLTSIDSTDVPEPASWAMLVAGIGVVGGTLRQRRRQVTIRFA